MAIPVRDRRTARAAQAEPECGGAVRPLGSAALRWERRAPAPRPSSAVPPSSSIPNVGGSGGSFEIKPRTEHTQSGVEQLGEIGALVQQPLLVRRQCNAENRPGNGLRSVVLL